MTGVSEERLKAVRLMQQVLDDSQIRWTVLHGAEGYPHNIGRDLDILVDVKDFSVIAELSKNCLKSAGWDVVIIELPWNVKQIVGSKAVECGVVAVEFDFITYLTWHGVGLLPLLFDASDVEMRDGLPCALWGGFVKRTLIQCLTGNWEKVQKRIDECRLAGAEIKTVPSRLASLVGENISQCFLEALEEGNVEELKKRTDRVRKTLLKKYILKKEFWGRTLPLWIKDRWSLLFMVQRAPIIILRFSQDLDAEQQEALLYSLKQEARSRLVFPDLRIFMMSVENKAFFRRVLRESSLLNLVVVVPDRTVRCIINFPKKEEMCVIRQGERLDLYWNGEGIGRMTEAEIPRIFCELAMGSMHRFWGSCER